MRLTISPADSRMLVFGEHGSGCRGEAPRQACVEIDPCRLLARRCFGTVLGVGAGLCLLRYTIGIYDEITRDVILKAVVPCL